MNNCYDCLEQKDTEKINLLKKDQLFNRNR